MNVLFWNVHGRRNLEKNLLNSDFLSKFQIIFFSETWLLDNKTPPIMSSKDCFVSPAVATMARPSGGIEFHAPSGSAKLISKCPAHLCIELDKFFIIGVYFKPTFEFSDLIECICSALEKCEPKPVIIGGDFNLNINSVQFKELCSLLELFEIKLCSDASKPTFPKYSSTPDFIFCSEELISDVKSETHTKSESDHFPISISVPMNIEIPGNFYSKFDSKKCRDLLDSQETNRSGCESQISHLLEIFGQCTTVECRSSLRAKPWVTEDVISLKSEVNRALHLYQRHRSDTLYQQFREKMSSFKNKTKECIQNHKNANVAEFISKVKENGTKAVYSRAKKFSNNISSHVPLEKWVDHCQQLYQTLPLPCVEIVSSVPTKEASELTSQITVHEVFQILNIQKSKAKSLKGVSPVNLKSVGVSLATFLTPIFNDILSLQIPFPQQWLNSVLFFLYKKGEQDDPNNYRSLAIEDPIMKIFMGLLNKRLTRFAEISNLLPTFQFGFRANHSAPSAISLLHQCAKEILSKKINNKSQKLSAVFLDFKKAFDLTDRSQLFEKLQHNGIPYSICFLLNQILGGIDLHVKSNGATSKPFKSFNGVPQGSPLSPLLFSLYISDIVGHFKHPGVPIGKANLNHLMYADDIVIFSPDSVALQQSLDEVSQYCDKSNLKLSIPKTKALTFYKGHSLIPEFKYKGECIENVNSFCYLGVTLTTRLSAQKHVDRVIARANSRIGQLFSSIHLSDLPFPLALECFRIYILPTISYALPTWHGAISKSSGNKINSLFTKFLKRYLGIPYSCQNSLIYKITNSKPLLETLDNLCESQFLTLKFPPELSGYKLGPPTKVASKCPVNPVPNFFLDNPIEFNGSFPIKADSRRAFLYDYLDLFHFRICETDHFKKPKKKRETVESDSDCDAEEEEIDKPPCVCKFCKGVAAPFHRLSCPELQNLSHCQAIDRLLSSPVA